jgi:hypothetical protein
MAELHAANKLLETLGEWAQGLRSVNVSEGTGRFKGGELMTSDRKALIHCTLSVTLSPSITAYQALRLAKLSHLRGLRGASGTHFAPGKTRGAQ